MSLPSTTSLPSTMASEVPRVRGSRSGCSARVLHAGGERVLVALQDLGALLRELLPEPGDERLAAHAEPAREEAEDDRVLGLLRPRVLLRHLGDRDRDRLPRRRPRASGSRSGGDSRRAVVDDRGPPVHRQLAAELEEVLPVQGHRHVERAARAEDGARRDPHPARGLAAADLRPEALRQHRVVALEGGGGDHRVAGGDDAVSPGSGHADDEVVAHVLSRPVDGAGFACARSVPRLVAVARSGDPAPSRSA